VACVHAVTNVLAPDKRGSRLQRHEFLAVSGRRSHLLRIRGSAEIAEQFCQDRSGWCSYRPMPELAGGGEWWTHSLEGGGAGPGLPSAALAELLGEVLTLPRLPGADLVLALDWYKVVDAGAPGGKGGSPSSKGGSPSSKRGSPGSKRGRWHETFAGKLVAAGRHRAIHPDAVQAAATSLAELMAAVTMRHPLLAAATVIAAAPGHDRSILSFGEWVGREVARQARVPAVDVATRRDFRPPAKDLPAGDRRVADGEFFFREDLSGCAVLVIDDVCQTGQTAAAVACAARRAGAVSVYVLAGVRTRRR
jgi:hypothetical protein